MPLGPALALMDHQSSWGVDFGWLALLTLLWKNASGPTALRRTVTTVLISSIGLDSSSTSDNEENRLGCGLTRQEVRVGTGSLPSAWLQPSE